MSNRTLIGIVIIVTIVLLSFFLGYNYLYPKKNVVINLDMPESYKIGELITLDASDSEADRLVWKIIPETDNFKIIGNQALLSSPKPIDYTIILAASNGKDLDCQIFILPYKGKKLPLPLINEVIKKGIDQIPLNEFETKVKSWLIDSNLFKPERKSQAHLLSQSFAIIGHTIEKGVYETIDGIILATAWANANTLGKDLESWKPFLRRFQNDLESNPPNTIEDHILIWKNMSKALEKLY